MRIRKRKVPLPLSLLSPIPITDPHLFSRSPVQPQTALHHSHRGFDVSVNKSQPSDHLTTCDLRRLIDDGNSSSSNQPHDCLGFGGAGVESVPKSNHAGNKSITTLGAPPGSHSSNAPLSPLPPTHQEKMRWCDEDKAVPFKKRRGGLDPTNTANVLDSTPNSLENNDDAEKSVIEKEETKRGDYEKNNIAGGVNGKKGSKRGKTIMEGSRCSRVNGRGWRCCQPTLVGYSLCEHHLGKGRLRNMSSVRGRPSSMSKKAALGMSSSETAPTGDNDGESRMKKKRASKLGVVKARSLSSLLGQMADTTTSSSGDDGLMRLAAAIDQ